MADILSEIKTEFPRFITNLVNIISAPRQSLLQLSKHKESNREVILTKAIIYYVLSNLVCLLWVLPIYGEKEIWGKTQFLYNASLPLVFLVLSSLALKISWKIVGNDNFYWSYMIIFCYQMGTLFNFYLFTNFINILFLKHYTPDTFEQLVNRDYLKTSSAESLLSMSNKEYLIFSIVGFIFLTFSLIWFFYSWNVYRQLNKATKIKSVIAAIIYSGFMSAVFFIDVIISDTLMK